MADKKCPSLCLFFSYWPLVLLTCLQEIQDFSSVLWDLDSARSPPTWDGGTSLVSDTSSRDSHKFRRVTRIPLQVLCSNVCLARLIFSPILCVGVFCLPAMSTRHECSTLEGQKKVWITWDWYYTWMCAPSWGITHGCVYCHGCWERNLGHLEGWQVLSHEAFSLALFSKVSLNFFAIRVFR